jgi:hypothetical protein
MMKPITGQYECVHNSGVGLDYFTSRVDRLIMQANGRFSLIVQNKSRAANAAHSLISGQQVTNAAPETRREGYYSQQNLTITLTYDDGVQEQGQLLDDGERLQIGPNVFSKVSDSTFMPSTNRLQKDMDDIAKGLKIASTIGGFALKAAKGLQGTLQNNPDPEATQQPPMNPQTPPPYPGQTQPQQPPMSPPPQPYQGQPQPQQPPMTPPAPPQAPPVPQAIFCDQCGARARPGKRFCGNCGAKLYE